MPGLPGYAQAAIVFGVILGIAVLLAFLAHADRTRRGPRSR
ncbi:hypothetical protein ACFVHB_10095 [Kitasatospora sp. NPDC127111]